MTGIFKRMIMMELLRIFFLCWLALTGIILMGGVFAEATQQGLGPGQILSIMPYLIPNMVPYTLPTTTLFATCIVYGRLAQDNEILAIKAAGVHISHVVRPAIILGVTVSAITIAMYINLIPEAHWELRTKFLRDVKELLYAMLRKDGAITHGAIPYHIWVQKVEGETLIDTLIYRRNPKTNQYDFSVRADEAKLDYEPVKKQIIIKLRNAKMIGPDGGDGGGALTQLEVDIPPEFGNPQKTRGTDMTWLEIFDHIDKLDKDIEEIHAHLATWNRSVLDGTASAHILEQIDHHEKLMKIRYLDRSGLVAELHMRPALALGCLCFVLVGCPVGIWLSKSDYISAFITCFLPIVIIYYPLLLCGINLAKAGKVTPGLIVWPANILLAITALYLFRKLARN